MKRIAHLLVLSLVVASTASAAVRVYVEDVNGLAAIKYQTDGETVRAFGLDVTVDSGTITAISGFHRGPSTAESKGYGIFIASFARSISVDPNSGTVENWNVEDYTPLADPADPGALGGLGTDGVTLELAGLWDTTDPAAIPDTQGTLCLLQLSQAATVTIKPNVIRAGETGIVLTNPEAEPQVLWEDADNGILGSATVAQQ